MNNKFVLNEGKLLVEFRTVSFSRCTDERIKYATAILYNSGTIKIQKGNKTKLINVFDIIDKVK